MSKPVYTTLQQIVDQLEYCGYESKDSLHRLEDNVAFVALKERAAAELVEQNGHIAQQAQPNMPTSGVAIW